MAGVTSWDSSVIYPLAQNLPLKNLRMSALQDGAILCQLTCLRILSFKLLLPGHLVNLRMTWHPDSHHVGNSLKAYRIGHHIPNAVCSPQV